MLLSNRFSLEQILALLVVGFGFWMSTHNDECRRSLTIPVMGLGGVIFVMYASNCISRVLITCLIFGIQSKLSRYRFVLQIARGIPRRLEEHLVLALDSILIFLVKLEQYKVAIT